jgi:hypothetical protein
MLSEAKHLPGCSPQPAPLGKMLRFAQHDSLWFFAKRQRHVLSCASDL